MLPNQIAAQLAPGFPLVSHPDRVLFTGARSPVTGQDLLRAAWRIVGDLPEAPVVNLCRDPARFAAVFLATLLRGGVSLLVSDRSPDRLRGLGAEHPGCLAVSDDPGPAGPIPTRHLADPFGDGGRADNPTVPAERLAAIVSTSGSTGVPVAHRKPWGALAARSLAAGSQLGLDAARPASILGTVPPQHMYGFELTALLPLHAAAAVACADAFYPADIRRGLAAAAAPRILVTTPLQLRALLRAELALPEIEAVVSATAPLDPALAAEAEARWRTRVVEIYGATEVGSIASRRTVAGEAWHLYPGVTLDGAVVSAPHAVPHALGDLIEPAGPDRFRMLGRRDDLIKLGGRRASLAGLNAILAAVPGVTDGVFVPPEADGSPIARMRVFVVADRPGPEIMAALRDRVDPAFLPRQVVQVAALPRNAAGKLPRAAVAAMQAGPDGA